MPPSVFILGNNIFYGHSLHKKLAKTNQRNDSVTIFAYHVQNPERYGVVEFDNTGKIIGLEEKSACPKSNYVVTGLYFYDSYAPKYVKQLQPSL